jgi:sodium/bile acid cotransporter 7
MKPITFLQKILAFAKQQWFLVGLFIVVGIAAAYPPLGKKNGLIRAEITVTYIGVGIIFLLSGLSLKTKALAEAFIYWKLIVVVQLLSLAFIPAVAFGIAKLLMLTSFDRSLAEGLIIACACPTTISSNVLMTKASHGNEAAALTNAVLGSILGVFVSPALIIWLLGLSNVEGGVNYISVFTNLGITVIGPLIVGQTLRNVFPSLVPWLQSKLNLSYFNQSMLLLLVWSVFCDTFSANAFSRVNVGYLFAILFLCLFLFVAFSAISFFVSLIPWFQFTKQDSVAIVMCAATKTVALGIPLVNVIYAGNPTVGILSIPLLVYHAEQLFVGSVFVTMFQKWIKEDELEPAPLDERAADSEAHLVEVVYFPDLAPVMVASVTHVPYVDNSSILLKGPMFLIFLQRIRFFGDSGTCNNEDLQVITSVDITLRRGSERVLNNTLHFVNRMRYAVVQMLTTNLIVKEGLDQMRCRTSRAIRSQFIVSNWIIRENTSVPYVKRGYHSRPNHPTNSTQNKERISSDIA